MQTSHDNLSWVRTPERRVGVEANHLEPVSELGHQDTGTHWDRRLDELGGGDVGGGNGVQEVAAGDLHRTGSLPSGKFAGSRRHSLPVYTRNPSDFDSLKGIITVVPV
jgi:hypothetical protein